jgi:acyl-CoA synthetase (AMP-forming)/AMP-acid ligase II
MLLSHALSPIALRNGGNIAFRHLDHLVTYKEFWETSNRFSYYLQKEINHGLRVGLWMSNCPHVAYLFVALANTRNCTVPLNPGATPEENIYKIKHSGLTVILCSSDHHKALKEFLHQNALGNIHVIEMDHRRCTEYDPSYTPPSGHVPNEKDEILLFFTPGSTGHYKGCLFNHIAVTQSMIAVKGAYHASAGDVFYTQYHYSTPFAFIHFLMAPLAAGSTVFISDEKEPKQVLMSLNEKLVTRMAPKVEILPELIQLSATEKIPISTVKQFVVSGTTLSKETLTAIRRNGQAGVINVYGLTEYLGTVAMGNPDRLADPAKPGLIGPPLVGTKIRVVDDNNDEIDKKKPQRGQLLVMGQPLMTHYLDLPEEQKNAVRGTWLFTGDMVDIDNDGNVVFLDRKADIITLKTGKKVFAREIEPLLYAVPQIECVAFVGVRDRLKRAVSALVVVRKPGSTLTEKQLKEFLATGLPPDKVPDIVLFIDVMPRTMSGAINRSKLRSNFDGV